MSERFLKTYECGMCLKILLDDINEKGWHWNNFYATVHNRELSRWVALAAIRRMNCWNKEIQEGGRPLGYVSKTLPYKSYNTQPSEGNNDS